MAKCTNCKQCGLVALCYAIAIGVYVFQLPETSIFIGSKKDLIGFYFIILLAPIIPLMLAKRHVYKTYLFFLLVGFTAYSLVQYYREEKLNSDLAANGMVTNALVSEMHIMNNMRSVQHAELTYTFQFDKRYYSSIKRISAFEKYIIGDSIPIKFLPRNPTISTLYFP